jgi:hypothetical protein
MIINGGICYGFFFAAAIHFMPDRWGDAHVVGGRRRRDPQIEGGGGGGHHKLGIIMLALTIV